MLKTGGFPPVLPGKTPVVKYISSTLLCKKQCSHEKVDFFRLTIAGMILVICAKSVSAQNQDNYYTICNKLDTFYLLNPKLKVEEEGGYHQYIRWKEFWKNRVYGKNQSSQGSFDISAQAWQQYQNEKEKYSKSTVIGSDWQNLGPKSLPYHNIGQVTSIYVDTVNDKSMNTIYVGASSSGIWKTYNGGQTWVNVTDGSGYSVNGITSITGDPSNGELLYATVGGGFLGRSYNCGIGVLKSYDRGVTWHNIYPPVADHQVTASKIIMDPTHTDTLYAIVDSLLIRSFDAGTTWQTIFTVKQYDPSITYNGVKNIRDIEMKPNDPGILYIGTDDRAAWGRDYMCQIWKLSNVFDPDTSRIVKLQIDQLIDSPDTVFTDRWELAVTPADPEALYAQCGRLDSTRRPYFYLWKYKNSQWNLKLSYGSSGGAVQGIGYFKNTLVVSPTDTNIIYVGANSIYKYRDTVNTHNTILLTDAFLQDFHVDVRCAVIMKSTPGDNGAADHIFVGNDGGISKTEDGSYTWHSLNGEGLTLTQFWGMGCSYSQSPVAAAGSQDNCLFLFDKNDNPQWVNPLGGGGDNGNVVFDYFKPKLMYYSKWGSGTTLLVRDTIGPVLHTKVIFDPNNLKDGDIISIPFMLNPRTKKSLYFGYHHLYRSSDYGQNYDTIKIISDTSNHRGMNAFGISKTDTMTIYAVFDMIFNSAFFKSHNNNGQYVWENLSDSVQKYCSYYKITSVEVSPTTKDSIWISFGGYLDESDSHHIRVMLSTNGGQHWDTAYSDGLPNMPVNCLKYNPNGRRLFAATDAGVFYRDYTMRKWQSFNAGLPVCIVSDLEINDSTNTIWASTFGRGMWATDLNCIYKTDSLVITRNQTWTHDTIMENSIYIDSSFTLTINCKVEFPPEGKIYVKQGAQLIVDHGTLTSHCNNMWQGIEVWGRSNIPQNLPYQGFVWIKNNSLIENARIGITTNNKTQGGFYCNTSSGGMIAVQNSTFRNNYKALEFLNYSYTQSSQIIHSTFETTGQFIDGKSYPSDFVSLDAVSGIKFLGCTFINRNTSETSVPDVQKGNGFYSRDGGFLVSQYDSCPQNIRPCPNTISFPSTFKGLYYGIKAINSNPAYVADVQKTQFWNNYRGVYLSGMNYAYIVKDTFNIAGYGRQTQYDTCYGLYLDRCSFYTVQENSLISTFQPSTSGLRTIGIVVNNSGKDVNEIYNNRFSNVMYGIIAENQNRNSTDTTGLCIKCNDFAGTLYDIIVNQDGYDPDWGIARNQGWKVFQTDPAGNTFSQSHVNSGVVFADIDNEDAIFNYFHHLQQTPSTIRVRPDYCDTNVVKRKPTSFPYYNKQTTCPSKISSGGEVSQDDLRRQLNDQQQSIDSVSSILSTLIDGGSTENLSSSISLSSPSDALQLRDELLSVSPYLSDTVMKSAIYKENVLPNAMIRDILVANPQAPKSDGVMEQLNVRVTPMPDSLLAEIQNGVDILGSKDSLGAELYSHLKSRNEVFNKLVYLYKTDTINPSASQDSLISLLQNEKILSAKYQLAFEFLGLRDTTGVNNTLNIIPLVFSLNSQEVSVHQEYITYFGILNSLVKAGKPICKLTQDQKAIMQSLVQNAHDPVKSLARNILLANYQINYKEPILLPDETKSSRPQSRILKTGKISVASYMKLFPNPSKQYLIVEYDLKDKFQPGQLTKISITTFDGKQIESRPVLKQQDQVLFNSSVLTAGSYICTIFIAGKQIESQKFIVVR